MHGEILQFCIIAVAATYPITVIHELAHAAVGALAGLRIAACGIGFSKPLIRLRLCGIVFYQSRSVAGGLTIACARSGFDAPRAFTAMTAAGPASDFCVTLALFLLWRLELGQIWVLPSLWAAGILFLLSAIPGSIRVGAGSLENDGMRIVRALRGRDSESGHPGDGLGTSLFLREFCRGLDAWPGTVYFTLASAMQFSGLLDHEAAAEALQDDCLADPRRQGLLGPFEAFVRAYVATAAADQDAESQLARAQALCGESPIARAGLSAMEAQLSLARGRSAAEPLEQAAQLSRRAGFRELEAAAGILKLRVEPPEDPIAAYRALQPELRRLGDSSLLRLELATVTAGLLAGQGRIEEARDFFGEAQSCLATVAARIPVEGTRTRFLLRASKPLREIVASTPDELIPLYLWSARAEPAIEQRRPGRFLAFVSGMLAALLLLIAAIVLIVVLMKPQQSSGPTRRFSVDRGLGAGAVTCGIAWFGPDEGRRDQGALFHVKRRGGLNPVRMRHLVFAPKGHHSPAQGNALGFGQPEFAEP